jgi:hypothetical protein
MFTVILNHYAGADIGAQLHTVYDIDHIDAGSTGCDGGLTDWTVSSNGGKDYVGTFSFEPGSCKQKIRLDCRGQFW